MQNIYTNKSQMMEIKEIKDKLRKKAVVFQTGGAQPKDTINQSWIGKVNVGYADEALPLDVNQNPMSPLMQLCLIDLPFIPKALKRTKILTVFISQEFLDKPEKSFCIREYPTLEGLVKKDFGGSFERVKPFPLFPKLIESDYPETDSGDIPSALEEIIALKEEEEGFNYGDLLISSRIDVKHKIGGYGDYCQSRGGFEAGYEFVLQIASDHKADLYIGHEGNIYFAKNFVNNQWQADWDCY